MRYIEQLRAAGVFVAGAGLELPSTATTIRFRDGERLVQDGPYADSKEQLGGLFVIEVPDEAAAIAWQNAARKNRDAWSKYVRTRGERPYERERTRRRVAAVARQHGLPWTLSASPAFGANALRVRGKIFAALILQAVAATTK